MKQFIVVRNGDFNQAPSRVAHSNEESAIAEAHRLASTNPGNKFVVYALVRIGTAQLCSVEWTPARPDDDADKGF